LRQPVNNSAAIASPAMRAARVVRPETEIATVTDTQPSTLPPGGPPSPPGPGAPARAETTAEAAARAGLVTASRRHRAWAIPVTLLATFVLAAIAISATLPSRWFAEKENRRLGVVQPAPFARVPASTQPIDELIRLGDLDGEATQYPPDGDFLMVTVMAPEQTLLSWLVGRDDPAVEFLTEEDRFGFRTPQQNRTLDLASMRTSEQVAQFVALQRLGFDVELVPGEVLIEQMVCLEANADNTDCAVWSPSDEVLDPGDEILSVEGVSVETVDDLSQILAGRAPGDVVTMEIDRPGEGELEVDVELTASPDDPDRTIVGFFPFDTARVVLPFEMSIDPNGVGGPSAGLAFTLTIIDELTEGELTGGRRVAVTGTIDLAGEVGAIGGLRQKASAVAQTGVDLFLVPASQSDADIEAARRAAGEGVDIVPVATLDEALAALAAAGGDPIPPPPDPAG
jgi:PDZ domain-containing protein